MKQTIYLILLAGFFSFSGKTAAQEIYSDAVILNNDSIDSKVADDNLRVSPKEEVENRQKESVDLVPAPQSLQNKPQYIFQKKRNPGLAFLYSFLFPGGGQYYNGQYTKGGIMTGLAVASYATMLSALSEDTRNDFGRGIRNMVRFSFGTLLCLGSAMWSMIDAPIVSCRINKLANIRLSENTNLHIRPDCAFSNVLPGGRTAFSPSIGMKFSLTLK